MSISREQLYEEVWAEPMTKVATRYGTYLTVLARICDRLNVPRPPQGYWLKSADKRVREKPPLPEPLPGDELEWVRGEYRREATPLPETAGRRRRMKDRPSQHPLLVASRAEFEGALTTEVGYLRPAKYTLVDAFVSKAVLSRAFELLNGLFLLLERRGHRVVLAPRDVYYWHRGEDHREKKGPDLLPRDTWSPARPTLVFVNGVAYGLRLQEMAESIEVKYVNGKYIPVKDIPESKRRRWAPAYEWTTYQDRPSGRLSLLAYSAYPYSAWTHHWTEKSLGTLGRNFRDLVRVLESQTEAIRQEVAEGIRKHEEEKRKWEEERLQRLREEEERRRKKALSDSREQFLSIVETWARARDLEAFFEDALQRVQTLPHERQDEISQRLARARELFGGTDALHHFGRWIAPEER